VKALMWFRVEKGEDRNAWARAFVGGGGAHRTSYALSVSLAASSRGLLPLPCRFAHECLFMRTLSLLIAIATACFSCRADTTFSGAQSFIQVNLSGTTYTLYYDVDGGIIDASGNYSGFGDHFGVPLWGASAVSYNPSWTTSPRTGVIWGTYDDQGDYYWSNERFGPWFSLGSAPIGTRGICAEVWTDQGDSSLTWPAKEDGVVRFDYNFGYLSPQQQLPIISSGTFYQPPTLVAQIPWESLQQPNSIVNVGGTVVVTKDDTTYTLSYGGYSSVLDANNRFLNVVRGGGSGIVVSCDETYDPSWLNSPKTHWTWGCYDDRGNYYWGLHDGQNNGYIYPIAGSLGICAVVYTDQYGSSQVQWTARGSTGDTRGVLYSDDVALPQNALPDVLGGAFYLQPTMVVHIPWALSGRSYSYSLDVPSVSVLFGVGGTAVASPISGALGSTTTLTASNSPGYSFSSWTVSDAGGGSISSTTANPATFRFGGANATITANFVALNPVVITATASTGGWAGAYPVSGMPGSVVTLAAVPSPPYVFQSWTVINDGGGCISSCLANPASFTLGGAGASVIAQFAVPPISGDGSSYAEAGNVKKGGQGDQVQEPVDTGTGAHVLARSVLKIRGAQDLDFVVDYDSICRFNDTVGLGWSHNFEAAVKPSTNGTIVVNWNAKSFNIFAPQAANTNLLTCADLPVIYDTLSRNADGTFTLREPSQRHFDFDGSGRLEQIVNPHGQAIQLGYPPGLSYPTQILEAVSGKAMSLAYNSSGLLSQVTDVLYRTATFTYDSSKRLTSINTSKGPESQTYSFTYDSAGRILTETTPEGVQSFTDTYDSHGRVASQHDAIPGSNPAYFYYDESQTNLLVTTVVDRTGATNVYVHSRLYQLLSITDPLGHTTSFGYDTNGNRSAVTNALQQVQRSTFDACGNVLSFTDAAGQTTSFSYDQWNNLLATTNPLGNVAMFTYDTNNNVIFSTDFMSNATAKVYDANSLLIQATSARGGVSRYRYSLGLPIKLTDPNTNYFGWSYDIGGRLGGVIDGDGFETVYNRNMNGNVTATFDPDWNMTSSSTYDSAGRLLTTRDAEWNVTMFQYDGNGNLAVKTNADGSVVTYAYDGEDRLISVTDGNGHTRRMDYDAAGRSIHSIDALNHTNAFQYDAVGNLVATVDALGVTNQVIAYDVRNQPISVRDALGNTQQLSYDALQRLTQTVDALNRTNVLAYDALSRLTNATDPMLFQTRQQFDADGNRTGVINPKTAQTAFRYDLADRLTGSATPAGRNTTYTLNGRGQVVLALQPSGTQWQLAYDEHGWLTNFHDLTGTVLYEYDMNGRLDWASEGSQSMWWAYDGLGRVTQYSDVFGNLLQYAYDGAGNLTNLIYPDGKAVAYAYDAANRLTTVTDWGGRVTRYAYDADNRITLITHPNGTTTTRAYDVAGRLIHQADMTAASNMVYQVDFGYDSVGQIVGETNVPPATPFQPAATTMAYDVDDALTNFCGQAVTNDANGNMIYGPLTNGAFGAYAYDAHNRLASAGGISYGYDPTGNRVTLTNNASATGFVINPNATLSQVLMRIHGGVTNYYVYGVGLLYEVTPSPGTNHVLNYHFDYRGSTVAITDAGGNITDRVSYAPYGSITSRSGTTDTPFLFNGSYGVQTDANGLLHMRARFFNTAICRFVNPDPIGLAGGFNHYVYVTGNPVALLDPLGLCADARAQQPDYDAIMARLQKAQQLNDQFIKSQYRYLVQQGFGDLLNDAQFADTLAAIAKQDPTFAFVYNSSSFGALENKLSKVLAFVDFGRLSTGAMQSFARGDIMLGLSYSLQLGITSAAFRGIPAAVVASVTIGLLNSGAEMEAKKQFEPIIRQSVQNALNQRQKINDLINQLNACMRLP